jgi:hypothetical protein
MTQPTDGIAYPISNNRLPKVDEHTKKKIHLMLSKAQMVPVMNKTKWSKLILAMLGSPKMKPEFRLRSILGRDDYHTGWDRDWHHHIHPVEEIEWIEIRSDSRDWLMSTLRANHIPFSAGTDGLRVWGYTKVGELPHWE